MYEKYDGVKSERVLNKPSIEDLLAKMGFKAKVGSFGPDIHGLDYKQVQVKFDRDAEPDDYIESEIVGFIEAWAMKYEYPYAIKVIFEYTDWS